MHLGSRVRIALARVLRHVGADRVFDTLRPRVLQRTNLHQFVARLHHVAAGVRLGIRLDRRRRFAHGALAVVRDISAQILDVPVRRQEDLHVVAWALGGHVPQVLLLGLV